MITAVLVWGQFAICVVVIAIAGVKLTEYGDAIADKTGMGGTWVGLVLIATVTSLPELAAGITASAVALLPNIAAGDVLGSCVYNLAILAILDLFTRNQPVLALARREHVLSGGFGLVLIGLAGLGLIAGQAGLSGFSDRVSWITPLLIIVYIVAIRSLHRFQEQEIEQFTEEEPDRYAERSLREIGTRYAIAAGFVIAAGIWLPYVSEDIAAVMGWGESFTGTLFTALSTSLPELVVTLSALRIGAIDMAVGNIFGSNMFNILVLAVDDLFYLPGPIYADLALGHLTSVLAAMTMTGAVVVALYFRPRVRVLRLGGWVSFSLIGLFALNSWLMFHLGSTPHG
ncbi:sodium:calcium antiporter [Halochromatium glycolicum]|uniref:sodium:calcium antiporter n=1 Tax=Halochromatium glycolicum TaxID=85075 RepID=UPI001A917BAE|nr:sodium:calcium antiporter [Halochromatium glycolicum]